MTARRILVGLIKTIVAIIAILIVMVSASVILGD
jgi:hypothetical protein